MFKKSKAKLEDNIACKISERVYDSMQKGKALKKKSVVKDILEDPDSYELLARVENSELVVRIRKQKVAEETVDYGYME